MQGYNPYESSLSEVHVEAQQSRTHSEAMPQVHVIDKLIGELNQGLDDLTAVLGPVLMQGDVMPAAPDHPEEAMGSMMGKELQSHVRRLVLVNRRVRDLREAVRV